MSRRRPAGAGQADELALDLFGGADPTPAPSPAPKTSPAPKAAPAARPAADASARRAGRARTAGPDGAAASPLVADNELLGPSIDDIPGSTAASAVAVSTVTATAKDLLEGAFLPLWVRGEVCDFKAHRNGHWYFALRDHAAQIRCVVWSRDQRAMPTSPDEGMQVTALAQLTVYAARGDLQLSVKSMEAAGDGLWRKALEEARRRLEADGLLAPERKRPLPRFPRCVAVVTSPSGAALHDVVAVARRRWAGVELVVVPAKVQGDGAPEEICAALEMVARWGGADVVIVGRGGGSRDDLWAFNDERVARAVAACPIPTVSAVGHEVDVTLCDLVADLRAPTPSAAAESVVPVHRDLVAGTAHLAGRLHGAMRGRLDDAAARRDHLATVLADRAGRTVERQAARTRELAGRLHALSPLATLARGYAVARGEDGRPLLGVAAFVAGASFTLQLRDGTVGATATTVTPAPPPSAAPATEEPR